MMRAIAVAWAVLFSTLSGGATAQQPAALEKVNLGYAFVASSTMPMWIAQDEGLFRKHGLDVKMILFQGSAAATQALLGGSVDMIFGSASAAITVAGRGIPVAVIATTQLLDYQLATRTDISSVQQLRGKSLGISAFSGGDDFAARRLLAKLGLTVGKDVKFVVLGTPNPYQKAEAVLNGNTDATMTTFEVVDTLKLQGKNMTVLAELLANDVKLSVGDIYAMRSYLKKSPETVKKFLRAYLEAIRRAKNDKQVVFAVLRKYTKTENDAILERIYQKIVLTEFQNVPFPHVEAILTQRDDMATTSPDLAKIQGMGIEAFVDNGPLAELEKEGFFASLPSLKTR
jgi:NitT/TauT family transport system substrate-binding protein